MSINGKVKSIFRVLRRAGFFIAEIKGVHFGVAVTDSVLEIWRGGDKTILKVWHSGDNLLDERAAFVRESSRCKDRNGGFHAA